MSELEDWMRATETSAATFREGGECLDRAVAAMAEQLPPLEVHKRGESPIHRYPEKSVDIALALKLIQLSGNVQAGEILIREGLFLEWDVVQRSMHDAWRTRRCSRRSTRTTRSYGATSSSSSMRTWTGTAN